MPSEEPAVLDKPANVVATPELTSTLPTALKYIAYIIVDADESKAMPHGAVPLTKVVTCPVDTISFRMKYAFVSATKT